MPNYLIKYYSTTHENLTVGNMPTRENCEYKHHSLLLSKKVNDGNDIINLDDYVDTLRSVYEIIFIHLCYHSDININKFDFFSPQHLDKKNLEKVMVENRIEYGFSFLSIKEVA